MRGRGASPAAEVLRWLCAVVIVAAPLAPLADGFNAHLEPGYFAAQDDLTDQRGRTVHRDSQGLTQNYQLFLDKSLVQNLTLSVGATYQQTRTWSSGDDLPSQVTDDTTKDGFARLTFNLPALRLGAGVERRERSGNAAIALVADEITGTGSWRAQALPQLDLQFARTHAYRPGDPSVDATTTSVLVGARYDVSRLELRYLFGWADHDDHGTSTETRSIDQTAQATYADSYLDGRTYAYASATVSNRLLSVLSSGPGGTVETQQAPVAGLSLVETFPATPESDTLAPNAALVDGNLTTSAGVNIGFGPALAGDVSSRDLGGQFADRTAPVNAIYVYTTQTLPAEVAVAWSWSAWQSDDNLHWTPVAITRPVSLGQTQDRLEIRITTTRARYLKVVTSPLRPGVTTERRFADVFVSEVQFWNIVLATTLPRDQASTNGAANATVRTAILRGARNLSWDVSAQVSRITNPGLTTYGLVNGLSYGQRLGDVWSLEARVSHRDEDFGTGRQGQDDWGATLSARPLPTLHTALAYSGTLNETLGTVTNSANAFGRGDLWEGVSAQANLGASLANQRQQQNTATTLANVTLSLTPNRYLTASGGWSYSTTTLFGPDQPTVTQHFERVDGAISATITSALSASATVSRIIRGPRPTTLASLQLSYAPLRGDLQLSLAASRTLDTAEGSTSDTLAPWLRWNVRRNLYLTASYSLLRLSAPTQTTRSRVLAASVVVYL